MQPQTYSDRGVNVRLTNDEKRELSQQARTAWRKMKSAGATDEREEEFRHRLAINACGRRVSEALRGDYAALAAAFLAAGGQTRRAIHAAVRGESEGKRIAMHKLVEACTAKKLGINYADSICRRQFKLPLGDASARQLWCLYYTVTNRGNAKLKKAGTVAAAAAAIAEDSNNPY